LGGRRIMSTAEIIVVSSLGVLALTGFVYLFINAVFKDTHKK